jgi:hypothetical protein
MGKLMKYELIRRSKLLITVLIVLVFLEGLAIYGLYRGGDNWAIVFFLIMIGMGFAAFIVPLIDTVANYYSDFKHPHGYMIFLTPKNGFQIIGSKALFALLELLAAMALVAGFYVANFYLGEAFGYTEAVADIRKVFQLIPQMLGTSTFKITALGIASAVLQFFNIIMLAITALTVAKTLLSQKSFNWLIALLLYLALATVVDAINGLVLSGMGFFRDLISFTKDASSTSIELGDQIKLDIVKYILISIKCYIVWIGAEYAASSLLLNKRVDL